MKKLIVRILLATLFVACGSTVVLAGGSNPRPPFCFPGSGC
jgi:hypothetical protein